MALSHYDEGQWYPRAQNGVQLSRPPRAAVSYLTAVARLEATVAEIEGRIASHEPGGTYYDWAEQERLSVRPLAALESDLASARAELRDLKRSAVGGELVPVEVAAERLGIPSARIRKWIQRGTLLAMADPQQTSRSTGKRFWQEVPDSPKIRRLVYLEEVRALIRK
jgi:hypothetical protein